MKRPLFTVLSVLSVAPLVMAAPKPTAAKKPVAKPAAKPKPKPKPISKPPVTTDNGQTAEPAHQPEPQPVAEPEQTGPKTWAVLVGVSHYENSGIQSLNYPAADATAICNALIDPNLGAIPKKQTKLLTDAEATRDNILGAVDSFLAPNVKEGDKVIFFLAGHGVAKGAGLDAKSYFLPTDLRGLTTAAFDSSAVPLSTLRDKLGKLKASQFVVFVDACREDPTPGRALMDNTLTDVLSRGLSIVPEQKDAQAATFFACSVGQRAFEDKEYGHGVFTNWILQGIEKGAVAQKNDGSVDMGVLSSYVVNNVKTWADKASASGDFDISQTPELVTATTQQQDMVLLKVKRHISDAPIEPSTPRLSVAAFPAVATVEVDGKRIGVGNIDASLASEGAHTVTISAPGYAPVSRSVTARGGFEHQMVVQLEPTGAGGVPTAPGDQAADFYKRAEDAMSLQQWEIAEQGFNAAVGANPKFTAPYEALTDLHRMEGRNVDAIADSLGLLANAPGAHALAQVSRAYSQYALKGAGTGNLNTTLKAVNGYGTPKKPDDAAKSAVKAAAAAVTADPASTEANVAQGYALAALDTKSKNKAVSLAAFGKAAFQDPNNAAAQLGLGYGIRFYAMNGRKGADNTGDINRAIDALNKAVKLNPNYYEAHRELAFCYLALDNSDAALKECQLARANRGAAADVNEIAGIEVAMAGIHKKTAENSTGDTKTANEQASDGYMAEAKETAPNADLKIAMSILGGAGISTSLQSYLPPEVQNMMGIMNDIKAGNVGDVIGGRLGGIFGR